MLRQIELTTSEARTPAEKMNAVKQSLAKIEVLVNGYNELVPSINAMVEEIKNFELPQIEDNTERLDRIEQSIAQMVESIGSASSSIEGLKTSISQLDKKQKLAVKTVHKKEKYDDSGLMKIINEQSRMMNEIEKKVNSIVIPEIPEHRDYDDELLWSTVSDLCRAINGVESKVSSIKMPSIPRPEKYDDSKLLEMINAQSIMINKLEKRLNEIPKPKEVKVPDIKPLEDRLKAVESIKPPSLEPLIRRIDDIENKPPVKSEIYDDSEIKSKVEDTCKIAEQALKTSDYLRRSYSEKWEGHQFDRAKLIKEFDDKISSVAEIGENNFSLLKETVSLLREEVGSIVIPEIPRPEKYDDSKLIDLVNEQSVAIKKLEKMINSAPKPKEVKVPDIKPLEERIKALEVKPEINQEVYDDSAIALEVEKTRKLAEQALKTSDYLRRSYSERWENERFDRAKFEESINVKIDELGMSTKEVSELKEMVNSIFD